MLSLFPRQASLLDLCKISKLYCTQGSDIGEFGINQMYCTITIHFLLASQEKWKRETAVSMKVSERHDKLK